MIFTNPVLNTFKNGLDGFCANQELICDYYGALTGTGNWSFVDSINVNTFLFQYFDITHLKHIESSAFTPLQLCFACCFAFALLCLFSSPQF